MNFVIELGLDTLSYSLSLLLVCLGVVIIFGLLKVLNMEHGEFFLLGDYCMVAVQQWGVQYWAELLLGVAVLAVVGVVLVAFRVRYGYPRCEDRGCVGKESI